ncbi:MAG: hypothetical protein EOM11_03105 [Erysipelotrichia bacterium]|nr:hypothetical protein [Erysipelotrichia bacterium]
MKKLFIGLFSLLLASTLFVSDVFANTEEVKIKDALLKVQAHYMQKEKVLYSVDDVLAITNLGIDVKSNFTLIEDMYQQDFSTMKVGTLAKTIMAFSLMGVDVTSVNGTNLVALLESYVREDGAIMFSQTEMAEPNIAVWCLYALLGVESDKSGIVADDLAKKQLATGAFWYSYNGSVMEDEATTGWVIEALSVTNKEQYTAVIEKAIAFLKTKQQVDGSYGEWGASADTQAVVLQGLLAYDEQGVKSGRYDIQGVSPYDTLLAMQDENGGFTYLDWQSNEYVYSAMTTYNAALSLGTYFNGSFVYKVQNAYRAIEESKKGNEESSKEVVNVQEETKVSGPTTADTSDVTSWIMLMLTSFISLLFIRKYHAKA